MGAPKGDKYWAQWSWDFCQIAKVSPFPNQDYGKIVGMHPKAVSVAVHRMRDRGFITAKDQGLFPTEKTEILVRNAVGKKTSVVAFELKVRAKTKQEALAEVWDVVTQLESWDPRTGEPFKLQVRHITSNK